MEFEPISDALNFDFLFANEDLPGLDFFLGDAEEQHWEKSLRSESSLSSYSDISVSTDIPPIGKRKERSTCFTAAAPGSVTKKRRFSASNRAWKEEEYILLSGITMTYFGQCHSMKEARKTVDYGSKSITTAWFNIQQLYEVARLRMNELYDLDLASRSPNALRKKWKDSGSKVDTSLQLEDESQTPNTILQLIKFNTIYNKSCILTCSEERYKTLKNSSFKSE